MPTPSGRLVLGRADEMRLAEIPHGLAPAEDFFDELFLALADRRASGARRSKPREVLPTASIHEAADIVVLVATAGTRRVPATCSTRLLKLFDEASLDPRAVKSSALVSCARKARKAPFRR
jgi:hypothetical protein